jgi:SPOR domain
MVAGFRLVVSRILFGCSGLAELVRQSNRTATTMSKYGNDAPGLGQPNLGSATLGSNVLGSNVTHLPRRQTKTGPSRMQIGIWLALGAGAALYLGTMLLAPQMIQGATASANVASLDSTRQEVNLLADTVAKLQQSIDEQGGQQTDVPAKLTAMHDDLVQMRQQVAGLSASVDGLAARVNGIEQAKGGKLTSKALPTVTAMQPAQQAVVTKSEQPDASIDGLVIDEPAPAAEETAVKVLAPTPLVPKAKQAKTALLTPPAVPDAQAGQDGTQPAAPAARAFGLELAISTSPEALRLNWELLNEQHGAVLAGLSPRSAPKGKNLHLLAGPFDTAAKAAGACKKLEARGLSCTVAPFSGSAL